LKSVSVSARSEFGFIGRCKRRGFIECRLLRGPNLLSTASISREYYNFFNPLICPRLVVDAPFQEWIDDYHQNHRRCSTGPCLYSGDEKRGWGVMIQVSSRNAISPHRISDLGAAKAALNIDPQLSRSLLELASPLTDHARPDLHHRNCTSFSSRPRKQGMTTLSLASSILKNIATRSRQYALAAMDIAAAVLAS